MIHVACRPARARGVPSESKQPGVWPPKLPSRHPPEITANPFGTQKHRPHADQRVFWSVLGMRPAVHLEKGNKMSGKGLSLRMKRLDILSLDGRVSPDLRFPRRRDEGSGIPNSGLWGFRSPGYGGSASRCPGFRIPDHRFWVPDS